MATYEIPAFPEIPAHTIQVSLEGSDYVISYTYRERGSNWYMGLFTVQGEPLYRGRRLSPDSSPHFNIDVPGAPPGQFIVRGPADYSRFDLGNELKLVYVPISEILEPVFPLDELRAVL